MWVMPSPSPSIDTNRSILSFSVSLNSRFTPRRSPSPSSPTVPTNVIVPGVVTPVFPQRPGDGQQIGKPAAIVADTGPTQHVALAADFDVGAGRKYGVEVRAHDEIRTRARARPLADDIALGIDADVPEADLAEHLGVQLRAFRFLERWRLDFADPDLIGDGLQLVGAREVDSGPDCRCLKENGAKIGRTLLCGHDGLPRAAAEDGRQQERARPVHATEKYSL